MQVRPGPHNKLGRSEGQRETTQETKVRTLTVSLMLGCEIIISGELCRERELNTCGLISISIIIHPKMLSLFVKLIDCYFYACNKQLNENH
jgi:hypothetical protein